jgi:hypothetical protein
LDTPRVRVRTDKFKAEGAGGYDIRFSFANGGRAADRFTAGEYVTYQITGIQDLSAWDFAYLAAPCGATGPFYAAACVRRIGSCLASDWLSSTDPQAVYGVPEPGPVWLLGLGACFWAAGCRARAGRK